MRKETKMQETKTFLNFLSHYENKLILCYCIALKFSISLLPNMSSIFNYYIYLYITIFNNIHILYIYIYNIS